MLEGVRVARPEAVVKAEALVEEAERMENYGHPREWSERLRNRAEYFRVDNLMGGEKP